ncbi:hypothetical protein BH20ACT24_BH20ACT24_02390 [soil metagenome]
MPPLRHTVSSRRILRADPQRVMALIADPTTWPRWQPEVFEARGLSPVQRGSVIDGRARMLGFDVTAHSTVTEATRSLMEQDVVVGVGMRVRYRLSVAPGGCVLEHRIEADLPRGLSGRVLSLFLRPRLRRMQRRMLDNLADGFSGA